MTKVAPQMKLLDGETRKMTGSAISWTSAARPMGVMLISSAKRPESRPDWIIGVRTQLDLIYISG